MNEHPAHDATTPLDGRERIMRPGYSYLPNFIKSDEVSTLVEYFGALMPLWEYRHKDADRQREGQGRRRLLRPVYWLKAWQFACLGYYSEPDHTLHKCVRAEPYPDVIKGILSRLGDALSEHGEVHSPETHFNSALINFYGSESVGFRKKDVARLSAHKDSEPGPVVMLSVGQPALFEFVDPSLKNVHLAHWVRHRSVSILSGALFKDTLYHRVTRVRHGQEPVLHTRLPDFALRRVSVSFRSVPEAAISDFGELPAGSKEKVREYIETLSQSSKYFAKALEADA